MNKFYIAVSVAALLLSGCSDKPKEEDKTAKTKQVQEAAPVAAAPQTIYGASAQEQKQMPSPSDMQLNTPHIAKVLETMNGGGYTYAQVDEKGNVYWIAGPQANITVGETISFIEQMVMTDFTSKALNRTFDNLVFVSAIIGPNKSSQSSSASAMQSLEDAHKNCNHDTELKQEAAPAAIKVAKNANGYSVEELYAQKDSLDGKSIKVNAEVVKVSKNIMGKDWVHLQDGSGSAGTNDIIATSVNSSVQVGDRVTAEGVVKKDIDLGYGYKFAVLIEEAKFSTLK